MAETVTTTALIQALPSLLVSLAGIAAAAWFWRRHPAVSACTIAALTARVVVALGGIAFSRHTFLEMERGADPATLGFQSGVFNLLSSVLGAGALLLLVVAVFMGRSQAAHRPSAA